MIPTKTVSIYSGITTENCSPVDWRHDQPSTRTRWTQGTRRPKPRPGRRLRGRRDMGAVRFQGECVDFCEGVAVLVQSIMFKLIFNICYKTYLHP